MPAIATGAVDYMRIGKHLLGPGPHGKIEWGIKIHVSATATSAQTIANCCLPYLQEQGVFHKLLPTTESLASAATDNQQRKFITVYPHTGDHLDTLCEGLNKLLKRCGLGVGPHADCHKIDGDMPWGLSGYVFIRYGNFLKNSVDDDRTTVSQKLFDYLVNGTDVFKVDPGWARRDAAMRSRT